MCGNGASSARRQRIGMPRPSGTDARPRSGSTANSWRLDAQPVPGGLEDRFLQCPDAEEHLAAALFRQLREQPLLRRRVPARRHLGDLDRPADVFGVDADRRSVEHGAGGEPAGMGQVERWRGQALPSRCQLRPAERRAHDARLLAAQICPQYPAQHRVGGDIGGAVLVEMEPLRLQCLVGRQLPRQARDGRGVETFCCRPVNPRRARGMRGCARDG